jgi:hypothetical protein
MPGAGNLNVFLIGHGNVDISWISRKLDYINTFPYPCSPLIILKGHGAMYD